MRVLCCHTTLDPATAAALPLGTELVDLAADPVFGYSAAVAARWDGTGALAVIEHDIVPHDRVFPAFAACPRDWCVYPYWLRPGHWLTHGMGCARFTAAAQLAAPAAQILVPRSAGCEDCHRADPIKPGCWRHLDACIAAALDLAGIRPHLHSPGVTHRGITP